MQYVFGDYRKYSSDILIYLGADLLDLVAQEQEIAKGAFHLALIAQQRRGVEHRHHPCSLTLDPLAVFAGDPEVGFDDLHAGDPSEGDDDLRSDEARLLSEIADTAVLLVILRIAVHGRSALDDIGDIDVLLAVEVDGIEHFVEQLTCSADKRLALQILLLTGTLADEHHPRLSVADAENDVVATLAQSACRTALAS